MLVRALLVVSFVVGFSACGGKRAPRRLADGSDPPNTPCDASRVCKVWGWCAEQNGECVATSNDHCRASEACQKGGLCSLEGVKCVAREETDCDRSEWCDKNGLCTPREGVCK
jgi:hypothetical protein